MTESHRPQVIPYDCQGVKIYPLFNNCGNVVAWLENRRTRGWFESALKRAHFVFEKLWFVWRLYPSLTVSGIAGTD